MHGQLVELQGKCKYHMKVRYGEKLPLPCRYPVFPFVSLAFGAVAVAAAVVADLQSAATGAGIYMAAHVRGAAAHQGAKCAQLPSIDALHSGHVQPVRPEHIGHFIVGRIIRLCKAAPAD